MTEQRVIGKSRDKLVAKLDEISPDYNKARSIYSEEMPAVKAIKEGEIGKIANLKDTQLKNAGKIIFDPSETDIKVLGKIRDEFMKENPDAWKGIIKDEMQRKISTKTLEKLEIMAATSMTTFWLMTGSTNNFMTP